MKLRTRKLRDPSAIERLPTDFSVQHVRGSGPGGQHRNKVATGVRITDRVTGLSVTATDSRSQSTNKAAAMRRLGRLLLAHYEREQHEEAGRVTERIRTYPAPRGEVVDHRTGERRPYQAVLDGEIEGFGR